MTRHLLIPGTALLLVLSAFVARAEELPAHIPTHHLTVLGADGQVCGHYLRVLDNGSNPPAVVGLVELKDGGRARLRRVFDREKGIVTETLLDLQSGWWIELRHDLGVRNLGGPEDFHDGTAWLLAIKDRHKRQRPTSTYELATSDGAYGEWMKPWEAAEEDTEKSHLNALAAFAAELSETDVPASAVAEIELLATLLASPHGNELSAFENLVEEVILSLRGARRSEVRADHEVQVQLTPAREDSGGDVGRLMKMLEGAR